MVTCNSCTLFVYVCQALLSEVTSLRYLDVVTSLDANNHHHHHHHQDQEQSNILLSPGSCYHHIRKLSKSLSSAFISSTGGGTDSSILLIIYTHNHLQSTIQLLSSIDKCSGERFQIVIVDDDSTDGTVEYLQQKGYAVLSTTAEGGGGGVVEAYNIGFR